MYNIYIGYDSKETEAYEVCVNSLLLNTSEKLIITPLKLDSLRQEGIYTRETDPLSSTEFTFSRFLVPYLQGYKGTALFCDCDFLFLEDVSGIFELFDSSKALQCCKHNYTPTSKTKMGGAAQHLYPRKNWSSLMMFNCEHNSNQQLTPELINKESGQFLHRFQWLRDEEIGEIPLQWNWLVDWYQEPVDGFPFALHFTEGGPWLDQYKNCSYNQEWFNVKNSSNLL